MEIEETEPYLQIQRDIETSLQVIERLKDQQKELLDQVPDSTSEYEEIKMEALREMRAKGLEKMDNVIGKWRVSKQVNTRKLMNFLQGDIDNFFLLAKVTQKDLKDFEKDNEDYKGASRECVEETGRELTDIYVELE